LHHQVFAGRAAVADAAELIEHFGDCADAEAALRARRSRDLGNFIHFCRWREAGRMIRVLGAEEPTGRAH
jgi:hypothetical protein